MTIDRALLRWARAENLARLARAIGLDLPPIPPSGVAREGWIRRAAQRIETALRGAS
jgi:hypothetical protein